MTGPYVRLRECVVKLDDDREECIFCGHKFGKGTSLSSIRHHLLGVKGKGVKPFIGNVPEEIKETALGRDGSSHKLPGVKLDDDRAECIFCGHKFGKGISLSRIRHHLLGVKGKGVKPCIGNVPEEIKEAALGRDGSSHKLPGGDLASGLADQSWDTIHAETAFLLEEDSEIRGDPSPPIIFVEDEEPRVDPSQPTNVSSRIPPGEDLNTILEDTAYLFDETRGDPLPTNSAMLLGEAFAANVRQIRSWIMDDEVSTIGIYGMSGVGKTELLKHIHNELLQSQDSTHRLYWVPVSQNFSIERLQNLIAKRICLDLSSEDDDQSRATKLSKELRLNQGWILFLDDLWDDCLDDFELDAVGIPETIKGCKLIVSTRSQDVCQTVADRCIKVNPLSHEEAVFLFKKKLGLDIEFSPEKCQIANCIVRKCGGLPLGIIVMARSMKRLRYNLQWRHALQDLEQSSASHSDMEKMEGVPPSLMDVDVNQLDLQAQEDNFNMSELPSSFNQSSMLCNYQAGQKTLVDNDVIYDSIQQTMITMGGLDGTSSSWINQNGPNWPQTPSSEQQWANELPMSNQVPGMLPQPPMNQCSRQFPYQFNQVPIMPNPYDPQCSTMLPEPSQTLRQEEEAAARIQVSKITSSNSLHKEPLIKMTRTPDRLWECVAKLNDDKAKCIFCGHNFGKGTPITRIRHHLSGVTGKGVKACVKVPEDIKEAALGTNGSSYMPPGEALASGLADQRLDMILEDTAFLFDETRGDPLPPSIIVEDEEPRGDPSQPTNVSSRIPPGEDLVYQRLDMILEDTSYLFDETRGDPLPTSSTMLLGRAFEANAREIRSWIMDDEVLTIGIYGMAGLGKTTLLKHIHNELLQSQDSTHRLYWVLVSQNFSIERLQNLIAKRIGLDLSSEDDDQSRATKLSKELRLNQRWILFLDDLWDDFELNKVGIPETIKGCKLIVSTRSEGVCQTVASRSIRVNPLSREEAVSLFMKKLGHTIELSPEKKRIAKCIVNECGGLPLGIIAMAGSMKRLRYDRQWKNALQDLEQSSAGHSDMEKVFPSLKSSYTHLKKFDQEQGFLYCALFPKGFMIPKDDLIAYLIDEGVIKKQESREKEFRRGHGLLDRLEDVCLLESFDGGSVVKMHELIRGMAIEIYDQECGTVIIKAGEKLKNLSGAREWGESLVTASLIENQIKEIPSRHSPRCPKLSTLLLHYNRELELIDDTFFNQLHGLKILDLSHTVIEKLPNSVSNLVRLTTLLLNDCKKLVHVPSLEKLREMKRLDLYRTALENIPQGLECLSELRYLRMSNCGQKEFPGGILRELSHLQVFILGWGKNAPMIVKGEEVGCLEKLEDLECHFNGHSDLVKFFNYRDQTHSLKTYKVRVGHLKEKNDGCNVKTCYRDKAVGFDNLSVNKDGDFQVTFPNDNQELITGECRSRESFTSSSRFRSAPLPLPSNNGKYSCLTEFYCSGCKSMKKLLPHVFLENLEVIEVSDCEKMVEIIETESDEGRIDDESSRSSSTTKLELPKLKTLKLIELPELKSISSATLICNSLEVIYIKNCEKLKRIPIFLPFLESNQSSPHPSLEIIIHPEERWESALEWNHPNAKDALRRFVKFQ